MYKELNILLSNLERIRDRSKRISTQVVKKIDEEGEQGESGLSYEIYPFKPEENIFIKLTINTDSYGYNEFVNGIQFVSAVEKLQTVYEKI